MKGPGHPEYELVLMIVSLDQVGVIQRIKGLRYAGEYILEPRPGETIEDTYFDTVDQKLGRRRLNLRLREASSSYKITLKKSPGRLSLNRNQRDELELDWSPVSYAKIIQEVSRLGVALQPSQERIDPTDPLASLKSLGLDIIQRRETDRESRAIFSRGGGEAIAELAIDSVTYRIDVSKVRIDELEIEAKSDYGREVANEVSHNLRELIGPELRGWKSGKLATGKKIESLLQTGQLQPLITGDGRLKPEAYDLILHA